MPAAAPAPHGVYKPRRPVVAQVADRLLAFGVLEHGFARIRATREAADQSLHATHSD
jgi:hypothetical protein